MDPGILIPDIYTELTPCEVSKMLSLGKKHDFPRLLIPKACLPLSPLFEWKGPSLGLSGSGVLSTNPYRERVTLPSQSHASFDNLLLPKHPRHSTPSFLRDLISYHLDCSSKLFNILTSGGKKSGKVYTITFDFIQDLATHQHRLMMDTIQFLRNWRSIYFLDNDSDKESRYHRLMAHRRVIYDVVGRFDDRSCDYVNATTVTVILRYPESIYYKAWTKDKLFYDGIFAHASDPFIGRHSIGACATGLISGLYNKEIKKQKGLLTQYNTILKLYFIETEHRVNKCLLRIYFRRLSLVANRSLTLPDNDSEVDQLDSETITKRARTKLNAPRSRFNMNYDSEETEASEDDDFLSEDVAVKSETEPEVNFLLSKTPSQMIDDKFSTANVICID